MSGAAKQPTHDNPVETKGFALVEFAAREADGLAALFDTLGFVRVGRHREADIALYRQGGVTLLLNIDAEGPAAAFRDAHGPGVWSVGFGVGDADRALSRALTHGAARADASPLGSMPAIAGIGGTRLCFVDVAGEASLAALFEPVAVQPANAEIGVAEIDHVAFNLRRGAAASWATLFEQALGFRRVRYFHIAGKQTGLNLLAMASPCGKIRIPLNEAREDASQIEDFINEFRGEGVQHMGFGVADILGAVETLRGRGLRFQTTEDAYYEALPNRAMGHSEDVERLRRTGVLLDGDAENGHLLQIFSANVVGPMFFELIQRKGAEGFGEGNITALFEAVEAAQIKLGALKA